MYASTTIGLPVTKLEESITWYRRLLGDVPEIEPAPGLKEFQLNDVTWLQLYEAEIGTNHNILRLEAADIASTHARVVAMGASPTNIEEVPNVVKYFDFSDPSHNKLSFYALPDESLASDN